MAPRAHDGPALDVIEPLHEAAQGPAQFTGEARITGRRLDPLSETV